MLLGLISIDIDEVATNTYTSFIWKPAMTFYLR